MWLLAQLLRKKETHAPKHASIYLTKQAILMTSLVATKLQVQSVDMNQLALPWTHHSFVTPLSMTAHFDLPKNF